MKDVAFINAPQIGSAVSLIIPTDKRYPQYRVDEGRIRALVKKAEGDLLEDCSEEKTRVIINKLQTLISTIDHKHLSKALAIFVSSEKEKMIYLPFHVEEKLIIDKSFEIRDLLYAAKNSYGYLVLVIVMHQVKVYRGYNDNLAETIIEGMPIDIKEVDRSLPSRVGNFTTFDAIKLVNLNKFLRRIDKALTKELHEVDIPVIVCGAQRTLGHFKKLTKNSKKIVNFVEGNYEKYSGIELFKAIEPAVLQLNELDQQNALKMLEEAVNSKEYVCGIENVWRAAKEKKGRLLIVERDFVCTAKIGKDEFTLSTAVSDKNDPQVLSDAVDDIMERVLNYDGDIAFVNNGRLTDFKRIALITRY